MFDKDCQCYQMSRCVYIDVAEMTYIVKYKTRAGKCALIFPRKYKGELIIIFLNSNRHDNGDRTSDGFFSNASHVKFRWPKKVNMTYCAHLEWQLHAVEKHENIQDVMSETLSNF